MTDETSAKLAEGGNQGKNPTQTEGENQGKNPMQTEYERRRSVWRYVNNLPGPQLPPCEADALWLDGERSLTDVSGGGRDE